MLRRTQGQQVPAGALTHYPPMQQFSPHPALPPLTLVPPWLPPLQNKHKYQELQQRMDATRIESGSGKSSSRKQHGGGGQAAEDGQQQQQGGKGQVAKTAACQSPRAAAAQQAQQAQQQADPQKRLRAAQKKLRQIAALQEKQAGGQALQPEEIAKLAQRAQLEAEVAALQQTLPG